MITSGPLSEHELHSSSLTTSEIDLQRSEPGPSVIRINLAFDKREDYFLYPTDSCESYFVCCPVIWRGVDLLSYL